MGIVVLSYLLPWLLSLIPKIGLSILADIAVVAGAVWGLRRFKKTWVPYSEDAWPEWLKQKAPPRASPTARTEHNPRSRNSNRLLELPIRRTPSDEGRRFAAPERLPPSMAR
jgi:hypothetical protein